MNDDDDANRAAVEEFFGASERGEMDVVERYVADDMVMEWPQSGERFSGRDNVLGAMRAQQMRPEVAGERRIVGSGDVWVVMMPLRYGDDVYQYVAVIELAEGKVRHGTGYWATPFPPQEARAEFADTTHSR